jgi:hypothetical protein
LNWDDGGRRYSIVKFFQGHQMIGSLRRIQAELASATRDVQVCADALRTISSRWTSIISSFTIFPSYLQSYRDSFPDLQSKLELEQLSACDGLVAEITKGLVLLENAITAARSSFAKVKQTLRSQSPSSGWEFPPSDGCLGDSLIETGAAIDRAALALETQRLALYRLNAEEQALSPKAIERFLAAWT